MRLGITLSLALAAVVSASAVSFGQSAPVESGAARSARAHGGGVGRGDAATWVRTALEAMGGEARLRALEGVRIEGIGHTYYLEQSERFEGPWAVGYEQFSELRSLRHGWIRRTTERRNYSIARFTPSTTVIADGYAVLMRRGPDGQLSSIPDPFSSAGEAERTLVLSPERVLLRALEASDLRAQRDTVYAGVPHHVISFGYRGGTVRIFLNTHNALPSAVESRLSYPDDYFWNVWGDVTRRTHFSFWTLEPGGFRYPRNWHEEWEGKPYREVTLTAVDLQAPVPADSFAIPDDARRAVDERAATRRNPKTIDLGEISWAGGGQSRSPIVDLKPDLLFIPGGYNVIVARQPDGIVLIEAPFSAEYTAKILAEVERRFPGERVKGVVSTGDAWTYVGGVREYVARGIPVYALALNRPILEALVRSRRTIDPDALERTRRAPQFRWVSGKTVLGTGANRMEIYPIRGAGGERMLMVYFPEHRLLWGSDLVIGGFMPQYLTELADAVRREGLVVETVAAMHQAPIPWAKVTEMIEKVVRPAPAAQ